jgi:hypothetical protein
MKLKLRKANFEVAKTTYSRKIKMKGLTILFNDDGGSDYDSLALINMVRENAKEYLGKTSFEQRKSFIHFSELINKPKSGEVIHKIDVRSAYWSMALKRGVIEELTNRKLLEVFEFKSAEEMKRARLKALGSLATRKMIQIYEFGKLIKEEPIIENTKELYMDICRDVDNLMRDCVDENQSIIFYYWDCIFAPETISSEVLNYFKKLKYDVQVEHTKLEYVNVANTNWIVSMSDNKAYLVKKESRGLIEGLI